MSAAKAHAEQVAARLAARAVSVQGADTKATKDLFLVLFEFLSDALCASAQSLDVAELRVVAARADDVGLREARDIKKANTRAKALADMQREELELADQLGRRDQQVLAWVEDHQGIADTLIGLFRLAGRKDLAERVRPTSRALAGEEITPAETTTSEEPSGGPVPG
ncbi:hypothetical protein [Polyangium sp. 15x6]|uniref:hypothetical protein n=1 Tax=Polyangium sp. 15x6 TaxID=3042687 RepID=UPI00249B1109|nr:hypothetical protein [Polyangium sp. 15x6]MDI3289879.1 hypothetical protein [Polyangium sp. 15x6]